MRFDAALRNGVLLVALAVLATALWFRSGTRSDLESAPGARASGAASSTENEDVSRSVDPVLMGASSEKGESASSGPSDSSFSVTVTGSVLDEVGHPVSGGRIDALALPAGVSYEPAVVDSEGKFAGRISSAGPARLWLYFASSEATSMGERVQLDEESPRVHLEFIAKQVLRVTVIVADMDGRPVAGAHVEARGAPGLIEGTTDERGVLQVTVPCGTNGFWVKAQDGARGQSPLTLPKTPGAQLEHRIVLGRPWVDVTLRLVSAAGFPKGGVQGNVTVIRNGRREVLRSVRVDGESRLVTVPVDDVVHGGVSIEGMGSYRFNWTGDVHAGITIPIYPRGTVVVRLADESGMPLPRLKIWYRRSAGPGSKPERYIPSSGRVTTDDMGVATIKEVAYGTYGLYLSGLQSAVRVAEFVVGTDSTGSTADLAIGGLSTISGKWSLPPTLMDGSLPSVRLTGNGVLVDTLCKDDGTWAATLPVGPGLEVRVALRHEGRPLGPWRLARSGGDNVQLDYEKITRLRVVLTSSKGMLEGISLRLRGTDSKDPYGTSCLLDEEGGATLIGLPDGRYRVLYSTDSFKEHSRELGVITASPTTKRVEFRID